MKITKTEKIWLAVVIIFYVCYNLPFVPEYNNAPAAIIHGMITLIPLWIAIYVGLFKVCRIYKLKDHGEATQPPEKASEKNDHISSGESKIPVNAILSLKEEPGEC